MITKPDCRVAGMKRPTMEPNIEPWPPKIDVPPMTTAAMTLRLVSDWPAIVVVPYWASDSRPASPARKPERA